MNSDDFIKTTVSALLSPELGDLALQLITGADGLDREIISPRVQKPGLAFAGYYEYIKSGRVQIIGESETKYLQSLPARLREKRVRDVSALEASCFVVTKGLTPLQEFKTECEKRSLPLFTTNVLSSQTINRVTYFLEDSMAPRLTLHAGLLDVFGIGVLLMGDSGIGKSECALDLIYRGHRLIADDMVIIRRHPNDVLLGHSSDILRHHMELRGIGILDIKDMFGVAATRDVKPIDLVVKLEKWIEGAEYDRLGITGEMYECLGVRKPYVRLPVVAARNLALLVEIASRNHLMKLQGYYSAERFVKRIDDEIARQAKKTEDLMKRNPPQQPAAAPNAIEAGDDRNDDTQSRRR